MADLLVGVLAGVPHARLVSLAHGHGAHDGAVAHGALVALGAQDDVVLHAVDDVIGAARDAGDGATPTPPRGFDVLLEFRVQDHERAGALAPLPLQLPLGVILDQTLQLAVFRYC